MLQTSMNVQSKFKSVRYDSKADASRRAQTAARLKHTAHPRQPAEPNRPLTPPVRRFHPARELMICLGWLRLFQAIVADGVPVSEESLPQ
jgi:hypothetical protein